MFRKISFVVLCVTILAGCTANPTPSPQIENLSGKLAYEAAPQFTQDELQQLVASQNEFAGTIFLYQAEAKENLVISPYSLYQALSMLYAGAAGETASEMRQTMRIPWEDARVHRLVNALNQQLLKFRLFLLRFLVKGIGRHKGFDIGVQCAGGDQYFIVAVNQLSGGFCNQPGSGFFIHAAYFFFQKFLLLIQKRS